MRLFLGFSLAISAVIALSSLLSAGLVQREVFVEICELVAERFYEDSQQLQDWGQSCIHEQARRMPLWTSRRDFLRRAQQSLDSLGVSHLNIYSPPERRRLWQGEASETGIRARFVEGELVIYKLLSGSPAEAAGLQVGDRLLQLNSRPVYSSWQAETHPGLYRIQRGKDLHDIQVEVAELKVDDSPYLVSLDSQAAVLRISSFRSEYFKRQDWLNLVEQLGSYSKLVIDIRGNLGGNFVAMLRALSPFFCEGTEVGSIRQPRWPETQQAWSLKDSLDEFEQLDQLSLHSVIFLKTFSDYGCFKGPVTVLMDSETKSVAEIFAQSFYLRNLSRVWGVSTAGDVILSVWYGLHRLGPGYSLSIPEALFETPEALRLEGRGVWPQRMLFYELAEALQGQDSWVLRALEPMESKAP